MDRAVSGPEQEETPMSSPPSSSNMEETEFTLEQSEGGRGADGAVSPPLNKMIPKLSPEQLQPLVTSFWDEVVSLDLADREAKRITAQRFFEIIVTLSELILAAFRNMERHGTEHTQRPLLVSEEGVRRSVQQGLTEGFQTALGCTHQSADDLAILLCSEVASCVNSVLSSSSLQHKHLRLPEDHSYSPSKAKMKAMFKHVKNMLLSIPGIIRQGCGRQVPQEEASPQAEVHTPRSSESLKQKVHRSCFPCGSGTPSVEEEAIAASHSPRPKQETAASPAQSSHTESVCSRDGSSKMNSPSVSSVRELQPEAPAHTEPEQKTALHTASVLEQKMEEDAVHSPLDEMILEISTDQLQPLIGSVWEDVEKLDLSDPESRSDMTDAFLNMITAVADEILGSLRDRVDHVAEGAQSPLLVSEQGVRRALQQGLKESFQAAALGCTHQSVDDLAVTLCSEVACCVNSVLSSSSLQNRRLFHSEEYIYIYRPPESKMKAIFKHVKNILLSIPRKIRQGCGRQAPQEEASPQAEVHTPRRSESFKLKVHRSCFSCCSGTPSVEEEAIGASDSPCPKQETAASPAQSSHTVSLFSRVGSSRMNSHFVSSFTEEVTPDSPQLREPVLFRELTPEAPAHTEPVHKTALHTASVPASHSSPQCSPPPMNSPAEEVIPHPPLLQEPVLREEQTEAPVHTAPWAPLPGQWNSNELNALVNKVVCKIFQAKWSFKNLKMVALSKELLQQLKQNLPDWDVQEKPSRYKEVAEAVYKELCRGTEKRIVAHSAVADSDYSSKVLDVIRDHLEVPRKRTLCSRLRSVFSFFCRSS